jgi:hypothetical protein
MKAQSITRSLAVALVACLGVLGACSSDDSPTRPTASSNPAPGTSPASATFTITVTANLPQVVLGSDASATITVEVIRRENNQPPPNNASVTVTTNLGDFQAASSGIRQVVLALTNGRAQVQLFPGVEAGTAFIQARIDDSAGSLNLPFIGSTTFAASRLEPNVGAPNGGETVVLRGQGFVSPVRVEFAVDGAGSTLVNNANVLEVTPETVTLSTPPAPVSVPVGETLVADVRVTNRVNTPEETLQVLEGAFIYSLGGTVLQPSITSVTPNLGPNEGGTEITILGDGFDPPVQVIFGQGEVGSFSGVEAAVASVSRDRIRVASPAATGFGSANANNTVSILVRNTTSGFATVAPGAFAYGVSNIFISSIAPGQGPHQGGTRVLINGQGFEEPVAVGLAGIAAEIISVTGTQVVVNSGAPLVQQCANISGPVTLTNIETNVGAAGPTWTYLVSDPVVSSISPSSRDFNDPSPFVVTMTGFGFEEPVRVKFGDLVASNVVVNSPNSITVTVPDNFVAFDTEACDENGGGGSGTRDLPTAVDVTVENIFTTCTDTFQGGFTFVPRGICENDPEPAPLAPIADFTFTQNSSDGLFTVNFSDASTGDITSRTWDFGGEGSSTALSPSFTFAAGGVVPVTLTVSGPGGSNSITKDVNVLP